METPSRQPPRWRCGFISSASQQIFFFFYEELEGSILGFVGHTISVEITVPRQHASCQRQPVSKGHSPAPKYTPLTALYWIWLAGCSLSPLT